MKNFFYLFCALMWALCIMVFLILTFISVFIYLYSEKDTKYSTNYSEENFSAISCLSSPREVISYLGEPLSIHTLNKDNEIIRELNLGMNQIDSSNFLEKLLSENEEYLEMSFTEPASRGVNWEIRSITFRRDSRLISKRQDVYLD